jgi:transketolase
MNVDVLRPADGIETALAWCHALKRRNGPTALILTRQKVEPLMREKGLDGSQFSRGAYVVKQTQNGKPTVVLVATGSEVSVALSAQRILEKTMNVRVVSAPCRELLMRQPREVQEDIVPAGVPVVVIEAALGQGWGDLFRNDLLVLDIKRFGASAPLGVLAEKFGFTGNIVAEKVITWLKKTHA